jgi:hypothetical protein
MSITIGDVNMLIGMCVFDVSNVLVSIVHIAHC